VVHMTRTKRTRTADPRTVGGTYRSAYWQKSYTVTADHGLDEHGSHWFTVEWADGRTTTHCTAWDRRDSVVAAA
jgi:hypothetical protein